MPKGNTSVRSLIAAGLHRSGALRAAQALSRRYGLSRGAKIERNLGPRFLILCYHRIGTGGIPFYSELPTRQFEAQMKYLRTHCRVVSLDQVADAMADPTGSEPVVAVTFDDGYLGTYTDAFPVLVKYSIPATVYLTAGCIESGEAAWYDRVFLALQMTSGTLEIEMPQLRRFNLSSSQARLEAASEIMAYFRSVPNERRIAGCAMLEQGVTLPDSSLHGRMMNWNQVREMQQAGISFQAHTMTHPVLSRLDHAALDHEIRACKSLLEDRLDTSVRHFAYPFGKPEECGGDTAAVLQQLGFLSAATTVWGVNGPATNPFALRRVQIGEGSPLPMFALRLTQLLLQNSDEAEAASLKPSPAAGEAAAREVRRA